MHNKGAYFRMRTILVIYSGYFKLDYILSIVFNLNNMLTKLESIFFLVDLNLDKFGFFLFFLVDQIILKCLRCIFQYSLMLYREMFFIITKIGLIYILY